MRASSYLMGVEREEDALAVVISPYAVERHEGDVSMKRSVLPKADPVVSAPALEK